MIGGQSGGKKKENRSGVRPVISNFVIALKFIVYYESASVDSVSFCVCILQMHFTRIQRDSTVQCKWGIKQFSI